MFKRAVLGALLLVTGAPMLTTAESAPLGVLLLAVGVGVLALPTYLRRTRAG